MSSFAQKYLDVENESALSIKDNLLKNNNYIKLDINDSQNIFSTFGCLLSELSDYFLVTHLEWDSKENMIFIGILDSDTRQNYTVTYNRLSVYNQVQLADLLNEIVK